MGKAHIKFSAPALTDDLIIQWVKFSAPLTEVGRVAYDAPHPERALTVSPLTDEMYSFRFWQSSDGTALDTLLLSMDIDAGESGAGADLATYSYVVNRGSFGLDPAWSDPVAGETAIVDERLIGATKVVVTLRGTGPLRDDEFTFDSATGTITLVSGDTFAADDTWHVWVVKTGTSDGSAPVTSTGYSVLPVSSNFTFDVATHGSKILWWTGSALVGQITFPALSSLSDCAFKICTHGGSSRYLKLALDGSDTARFLQQDKENLYLAAGEEIEIVISNNVMYVVHYRGQYENVGQFVWGRKNELNRMNLDGTRYSIADLGRLHDDYISLLGVSQIVTEAAWPTTAIQVINGENVTVYPYKGFFTLEGGQVRLPDFRNQFIRAIKAGADAERITQAAGGFQAGKARHRFTTGTGAGQGDVSLGHGYAGGSPSTYSFRYSYVNSQTNPDNIALIPQIIL